MKPVFYLPKTTQVQLMRYFQRLQRMRGQVIVIRHKTVAARLGVSESTARRRINELVKMGHIIRTHVPRPSKGGVLCAYRVNTNVIYRRSSMMRQARERIEQVANNHKRRNDGGSGRVENVGIARSSKYNNRYKRKARPSINRKELKGLMEVAKMLQVDDKQRGYLKGAALKYGVQEAWNAFVIAVEGGYALPDLVRVTWGILKKQHPWEVVPT